VNVTTHAALVGALMPTSHNIIIFTLATTGIASVSVLGLIVACLIPALILTLCNLAAAYFVAVKRGYPTRGQFRRLGTRSPLPSPPPCPACW
jgi:TRAP-type C4-dicarboxylate transport system permease large subunit